MELAISSTIPKNKKLKKNALESTLRWLEGSKIASTTGSSADYNLLISNLLIVLGYVREYVDYTEWTTS